MNLGWFNNFTDFLLKLNCRKIPPFPGIKIHESQTVDEHTDTAVTGKCFLACEKAVFNIQKCYLAGPTWGWILEGKTPPIRRGQNQKCRSFTPGLTFGDGSMYPFLFWSLCRSYPVNCWMETFLMMELMWSSENGSLDTELSTKMIIIGTDCAVSCISWEGMNDDKWNSSTGSYDFLTELPSSFQWRILRMSSIPFWWCSFWIFSCEARKSGWQPKQNGSKTTFDSSTLVAKLWISACPHSTGSAADHMRAIGGRTLALVGCGKSAFVVGTLPGSNTVSCALIEFTHTTLIDVVLNKSLCQFSRSFEQLLAKF